MTRPRASSRRSRGQALVEFALIVPVFILVLVGLFDVGRAVYAYNTISSAARDAIRIAIVDQTVGTIQATGARQAVSLGVSASNVQVRFLNPDLTATAPCNATPVLTGCVAEVTVPYDFSAVTPLIGRIIGPIHMQSTSRLPVERTYP